MNPVAILSVAVGGALGSVVRYCVGIYAGRMLGTAFPWGTLFINVSASFLLGVLAEAFSLRFQATQATRILLVVGFCGGYSTFSTFSLEAVALANRGGIVPAGLYAVASVVLSVAGLVAGLRITRAFLI
ncbi:MAG TPA: fluoride efflux transporter CrcB [Stellaceae bacterium]|nr:fluoride efflux transporter CrcB [Stellaceae bacterium]